MRLFQPISHLNYIFMSRTGLFVGEGQGVAAAVGLVAATLVPTSAC